MNLSRLNRNNWENLESEPVTSLERQEIEAALKSSEYCTLEDMMTFSYIQDSLKKDHATV